MKGGRGMREGERGRGEGGGGRGKEREHAKQVRAHSKTAYLCKHSEEIVLPVAELLKSRTEEPCLGGTKTWLQPKMATGTSCSAHSPCSQR